MSKFVFKPGIVTKTSGTIKGSTTAEDVVGFVLTEFSVPYYNPCCQSATAKLPVGVDPVTGQLVKYDGAAWGTASEPVAVAVNVTGSVTAAQLAGGLVTSTSAAAVSVTLPTATEIATQLGASRGSRFQFVVDNSAGSNTVTVVVNTGITVNTPAITGQNTLTVSTANAVAVFEVIFTSSTTAKLIRLI